MAKLCLGSKYHIDIFSTNPSLERANLERIIAVSIAVNLQGRIFSVPTVIALDTYLSADYSIVAILVTQQNSFTKLPRDSL